MYPLTSRSKLSLRDRQLQRAAFDHLDVSSEPGILEARAGLGEHALGDLDADGAPAGVGSREPKQLNARSRSDLEHVLAGANARQLEHAPARLGLGRPRPGLVHRRESCVDPRHSLWRVPGLEHQVAPVLGAGPLARQPCGELLDRLGMDVVVRPQAAALGADNPCLAQHLEVVGDGGLRELEQRHLLQTQTLPACWRSTSTSWRRIGSPRALATEAIRSASRRSMSG